MKSILMMLLLSVALASCGSGNGNEGNGNVSELKNSSSHAENSDNSSKHSESSGSSSRPSEDSENSDTIQLNIPRSSNGLIWPATYSDAIEETLDSSDLKGLFKMKINEGDLERIHCSRFNQFSDAKKRAVYVSFIAAIAEAESDYELGQDTFNPGDGTLNIGMLQIDPASANRHAGKAYSRHFTGTDLRNPIWNLKVGTYIFRNQLLSADSFGRLFPARTYYWQVLSGGAPRVLRNLQKSLRDICRWNSYGNE